MVVDMPSLVIISPAPVIESRAREVILDVKFVEGMKLHCQFWPGQVCCVMRRGASAIDSGARFSRTQLGFEMVILDQHEPIPEVLLDEAGLVYCSADDMRNLDLPEAMKVRIGKLVYTVEQPLSGRIKAALADKTRSMPRRVRSALWNLQHERDLRRALKHADGLHFNGFTAQQGYRRLHGNALVYFDNRLRRPMQARKTEQVERASRLRSGAPLRLGWFGPMDDGSGAMDLVSAAFLLKSQGVAISLDLFGTGPQCARVRDAIDGLGLQQVVRLTEDAGFAAVIVPHLRQEVDLFVSARRLPDPVPSYVEAMGCGLPIVGYANDTWRSLLAQSGAGWESRCGGVSALAQRIAWLDGEREAIIKASDRALAFARETSFEAVFLNRMAHLRKIAQIE